MIFWIQKKTKSGLKIFMTQTKAPPTEALPLSAKDLPIVNLMYGKIIGKYKDRPIFDELKDQDGNIYDFDGIFTGKLTSKSIIITPGFVYVQRKI